MWHLTSGAPAARRLVAVAALALCAAPSAAAQGTLRTIGRDIKHTAGDIVYVWTAPFHASPRDWLTAGAVVGVTAAAMAFDEDVDRWFVEHQRSGLVRAVDVFREPDSTGKVKRNELVGDIGTATMLHPLNGTLYLAGLLTGKQGLRDPGMGCFAAHQASGAVRYLIYAGVSRTRPSHANGDASNWDVPGGEWKDHSFFGGHVANAIGCATFFSERFELSVLEPAMYGVALSITVARMADRRHWFSDQLSGLAIGYAVGKTVADQQKRRLSREAGRESRTSSLGAPYVSSGPLGTVVGWRTTF